jgi:predicted lysophospholipase L1 biosynthesis ABC-type transport system permease subunit
MCQRDVALRGTIAEEHMRGQPRRRDIVAILTALDLQDRTTFDSVVAQYPLQDWVIALSGSLLGFLVGALGEDALQMFGTMVAVDEMENPWKVDDDDGS